VFGSIKEFSNRLGGPDGIFLCMSSAMFLRVISEAIPSELPTVPVKPVPVVPLKEAPMGTAAAVDTCVDSREIHRFILVLQ
jgi:hypothetical protein